MKKKFFILCTLFIFTAAGSFARTYSLGDHIGHRVEKGRLRYLESMSLIQASQRGEVTKVKKMLQSVSKSVLQQTDAYGNNVFHVARNEKVFALLWNSIEEPLREQLLSARNRAGETPWMAHITYGHEAVFLHYFPRSGLYRRLIQVSSDLEQKGLNLAIAQIKRDELIKECSMGQQTLWSRADAFFKGAIADSHYRSHADVMKNVRDMIAQTAPFLVR